MEPIFELDEASYAVEQSGSSGEIKSRFSILEAGSEEALAKTPLTWTKHYWSAVMIHCYGEPIRPLMAWFYHLPTTLVKNAPLVLRVHSKKERHWFSSWRRLLNFAGYTPQPGPSKKPRWITYTHTKEECALPQHPLIDFKVQDCKTWLQAAAPSKALASPQPKVLEVLPRDSKVPFSRAALSLGAHPFILLYDPPSDLRQRLIKRLGKKNKRDK